MIQPVPNLRIGPIFQTCALDLIMVVPIVLLFASCVIAQVPQWIRPPPVATGDAIRIISTGGAVGAASLATGVSFLQNTYGLQVRQNASVLSVDMYYAGSDEIRAAGVLQGLAEHDTKALWAARGGYGTARLSDLDAFDQTVLTTLSTSPRWLIGYSDLTALHALWNRAGVLSMHAHMGTDITSASATARARLFSVIGSSNAVVLTYTGTLRHRGIAGVNAVGRLLGGNLSVLASLVGSGYLPSYNGAILFIEDTGEAAYSLDRLLTQLLRSEEFQGIVGIAIGQLLNADASTYTALELLDRSLVPLGIPVITGLPIGHTSSTSQPIVLGAVAEINLQSSSLIVTVP